MLEDCFERIFAALRGHRASKCVFDDLNSIKKEYMELAQQAIPADVQIKIAAISVYLEICNYKNFTEEKFELLKSSLQQLMVSP
jgi:hypothetical protein